MKPLLQISPRTKSDLFVHESKQPFGICRCKDGHPSQNQHDAEFIGGPGYAFPKAGRLHVEFGVADNTV